MHAHGFLEVVHAHCLRYSKEQAPSGLLGAQMKDAQNKSIINGTFRR